MRVETSLIGDIFERSFRWPDIRTIAANARRAEELGFDGVHILGGAHDPFVHLVIAAEHTSRLGLATNVTIAFPRSPMMMAEASWDLQRFSGGRFRLGLGTQVKAHNERRYSTPWVGPPGPRLREYVLCLKAIFQTFKNPRQPTYFTGQYYQFTLMTPFFNPGPIEHPYVPIYVACLNTYNARLGGELCDGVLPHGLCSPQYVRERILPAVEAGARKAGRQLSDVEIVGGGMVATGRNKEEFEKAKWAMRVHIAFYASTPTYRTTLDFHGWGELHERLHLMSREGKWREMAGLISDEVLETFAVVGTYEEIVPKLKESWGGIVSAVRIPTLPCETSEDERRVRKVVEALQGP